MSVSTLNNAFGRTRLMAVLCSLLFVFAVACGDDDETGNNGGANNGGADAGDTGGLDTGGDDAGGDDTGTDTGTDTGADVSNDTGACEGLGLGADQCDPKCQTGCDDGETCVPSRASQTAPITATCSAEGTATQGEACGPDTACAPGYGCYAVSADSDDATCREICVPSEGENACSTEGTACFLLAEGDDIGVCTVPETTCEIFPPEDTCGEGENCYRTSGGGTTCAPFNPDAVAGDTCATVTDCNDLQACAGPDENSLTCVEKCDPTAEANRCEAGEQCVAFQNDPNTGACTAAPE